MSTRIDKVRIDKVRINDVHINRGETVFIASANRGKIAEMETLLAPFGLRLLTPLDFSDYESPVEDSDDFCGNALLKARHGCGWSGVSAIADDSGLCCSALGGAPGVETARFGGDVCYDEKARLLWEAMAHSADKSAYFACAVACVSVSGGEAVFYGEIAGAMTYPAAGDGGWGYDPYFIPAGYDCSFASLAKAEKNRISHRCLALAKMVSFCFGD